MLDLDLGPAVDRDLGPDLPGAAPERDGSPVRDLFRTGFDAAYDLPGDSLRGERVMGDVQMEAAVFGDQWTTRALGEERFAVPADRAMNQTLVAGLSAEPGRSEVLHALKDGPETPGRGDDLVVLLDEDAVAGLGHTAVLVGNDHDGWRLYSKDGTPDGVGFTGSPTWTNDNGTGQSTGPRYASFETLDSFFENPAVSDRYEAAVRIEFEPGDRTDRGDAAGRAAEQILREDYHLTRSSCASTVEAALQAADVPGFALTRSRATLNPFDGDAQHEYRMTGIVPQIQFARARDYDGADDVPSAAQLAWEARGRDQDDGGGLFSSSFSSK